jgi:hypothetical protein
MLSHNATISLHALRTQQLGKIGLAEIEGAAHQTHGILREGMTALGHGEGLGRAEFDAAAGVRLGAAGLRPQGRFPKWLRGTYARMVR